MYSRYGLGLGLGASLLLNGVFGVKLQKTKLDMQRLEKDCDKRILAARNEPTTVSVFLRSSNFKDGESLLSLGSFEGRGKEAMVTWHRDRVAQGETYDSVGVTFPKKP